MPGERFRFPDPGAAAPSLLKLAAATLEGAESQSSRRTLEAESFAKDSINDLITSSFSACCRAEAPALEERTDRARAARRIKPSTGRGVIPSLATTPDRESTSSIGPNTAPNWGIAYAFPVAFDEKRADCMLAYSGLWP